MDPYQVVLIRYLATTSREVRDTGRQGLGPLWTLSSDPCYSPQLLPCYFSNFDIYRKEGSSFYQRMCRYKKGHIRTVIYGHHVLGLTNSHRRELSFSILTDGVYTRLLLWPQESSSPSLPSASQNISYSTNSIGFQMPWFLILGNTFSKTHCTHQRTLKGYWWLSDAYQWPHFPHLFSFCLLGYQRAWLQGYEMLLLPQRLIREPESVLWVSFLFRSLYGFLEPWGLTFLRATGILFFYNTINSSNKFLTSHNPS